MDNKPTLIIGAGLTGSTVARKLAEKGENVLLVEKRDHIGGNCYDLFTEDGQYIQKYGPHVFHTDDKEVWDFLSKFTEWHGYRHKALAYVDGKLLPLPFNLDSLKMVFPESVAQKIEIALLKTVGANKTITILELKKSKDRNLQILADYVYSKIFLNYTLKQWDFSPEELDPKVSGRIPLFVGRDNCYFCGDQYQGVPAKGFTPLFQKMLDHKNIKILLNTDFKKILEPSKFKRIIVTSPLDEFFDYEFGKISYRRIFFKLETHDCESFQENSVITYPNDYDYTRITECNKLLNIKKEKTTIMKEFASWTEGFAAYPVFTEKNKVLIEKYLGKAKKKHNVFFAGRLAECKYYDMDEACRRGLDLVEKEL